MSSKTEQPRYYSIQDAAGISGLAESTLRYYESIGLLQAIDRDPSSHHRRYSEHDLDAAIATACLSAAGLSINDMRTYLSNRAGGADLAAEQINLLERQRRRLADEQSQIAELKTQADTLAVQLRAARSDTRKQVAA